MPRKIVPAHFAIAALACVICAPPATAAAPGPQPEVIYPVYFDTSPPVRELLAKQPAELPTEEFEALPMRPSPRPPITSSLPDPVVQTEYSALPAAIGLNFDGLSNPNGASPPDTEGAVGATQYVQWVNLSYNVYDKNTGTKLAGPIAGNVFWSGFPGICQTNNGGDPVILYDKAAGRWVATQLAYSGGFSSNSYCVAVSTTSDALGSYNRYEYNFGNNLPDYPKLGVWPDGYYWSSNTFVSGASFIGAKVCAMDRAAMLAGTSAVQVCFQRSQTDWSFLPSDLDGSMPPPVGSPNYFIELWNSTTLRLYKFHADFVVPANSTFTGPTSITVASYTEYCFSNCVPQPGTTRKLDALGDRLMHRIGYRNFGSHEALVASHAVSTAGIGSIRWYEIRDPNGAATVFQQGTFAPNGIYVWFPSIAMDKVGNIVVGANGGNGVSIKPSLVVLGRTASDPAGTLRGPFPLVQGTGVQTNTSRWGDYAAMTIDPINDCTFWFTGEYGKVDGSAWQTRIASITLPNCN